MSFIFTFEHGLCGNFLEIEQSSARKGLLVDKNSFKRTTEPYAFPAWHSYVLQLSFLMFKLQVTFWMKIAEVKLSRFVVIYTSRGPSQFCVRIRNQGMSRFFWYPVCLFIIYTSEMKLNSHIS